jgi:hypothetical protein
MVQCRPALNSGSSRKSGSYLSKGSISSLLSGLIEEADELDEDDDGGFTGEVGLDVKEW